jgi:single-strand DNA-binding protein
MTSVARIMLIENLGRDPETRCTPNGRMNGQVTIAVNQRRTDAGGNVTESTTGYRVTAWGGWRQRATGWPSRARSPKGARCS